jgi:hypothetical protein
MKKTIRFSFCILHSALVRMCYPVAQQSEVPAETLEQMTVDVTHLPDVVHGDIVPIAENGAAEADLPFDLGEGAP